MVTLGITGGLGSGKSTASRFLKELGAFIFDADEIAKLILMNDEEVREELVEKFGSSFIVNGSIDTAKLAKLVFVNEDSQEFMNDLIHPKVINEFIRMHDEKQEHCELFVVDAPLIFESGFDSHLDYTALIYTKVGVRISRAMTRGNLTSEQIKKRMALQMPEETKREMADYCIKNNGTVDELKQKMSELYHQIID